MPSMVFIVEQLTKNLFFCFFEVDSKIFFLSSCCIVMAKRLIYFFLLNTIKYRLIKWRKNNKSSVPIKFFSNACCSFYCWTTDGKFTFSFSLKGIQKDFYLQLLNGYGKKIHIIFNQLWVDEMKQKLQK